MIYSTVFQPKMTKGYGMLIPIDKIAKNDTIWNYSNPELRSEEHTSELQSH